MSKVNYKKLGVDTVAFALSNIASKVIAYFLLPLYTAVLTTKEFGFADTIQTLVNLLYPILTLSISEALLRFVIDEKNVKKHSQYLMVAAILVFGSSILVWSMQIVPMLSQSLLGSYWIYVVLMYLGFNLEQCAAYYAKAVGKTKLFAISGVFHTVILICSNLLLLLVFKLGVLGYILSLIIAYFLSAAFLIIGGRLWRGFRFCKVEKATFLEMIRYSTPMIVTIIAWWLNTTADKYIIEFSLGIENRGLFAAAYKIPTIVSSLTSIFVDAWKLTMYDSTKEEVDGSFSPVYKSLSMFTVLVVSAIILSSEFMGKIFFAADYFSAWVCIPFLAAAAYYTCMSGYLASAITKSKATGKLLLGTLVGAAVNIVVGILLVPKYGIVLAAVATYLGFMTAWAIRLLQVRKIVKIRLSLRQELINMLCILVASAVMSADIQSKYWVVVPVFILVVINNFALIKMVFISFFSFINSKLNKRQI